MINLKLTKYASVDASQIELVKISNPTGELEIQFQSGRSIFLYGSVAKEALDTLRHNTKFGIFLSQLHLE